MQSAHWKNFYVNLLKKLPVSVPNTPVGDYLLDAV